MKIPVKLELFWEYQQEYGTPMEHWDNDKPEQIWDEYLDFVEYFDPLAHGIICEDDDEFVAIPYEEFIKDPFKV